ncbi:hypothetical protein [Winogradskyella sp. A2]|uniref:hypothetical protein n=1 Tax=Winogradskyella sp. A2 TaxID=3366944 RepID=UPI00398C75B7
MGEIIGEFIFYVLLNYIGGTTRWIFGSIWRSLFNKPKYTYKEYIYGPQEPDFYDSAHTFINGAIAVVFVIILVVIFT